MISRILRLLLALGLFSSAGCASLEPLLASLTPPTPVPTGTAPATPTLLPVATETAAAEPDSSSLRIWLPAEFDPNAENAAAELLAERLRKFESQHSLRMEMALGKGPCIKIQDVGMIADSRVVQWMVRTAEKNKIPYQREVLLIGGTDARAIQLTRAGVPAGCLSIPVRYVHSPSEMVDYSDVQNTVKLLSALLRTPIDL